MSEASAIQQTGFYLKNDQIYKTDVDEASQDINRKVYESGINLIKDYYSDSELEKFKPEQLQGRYISPIDNVWFWLYLNQLSYSRPWGFLSCSGKSDCDEGAGIAILVLLVFSAIVAGVITGVQSADAEKARQEKNAIQKEMSQLENGDKLKEAYSKMETILHDKWQSKTSKAIYTAAITTGLVLLILSVIAYSQVSSSFTQGKYFLYAGGFLLAAGSVAHVLRLIVEETKSEKTLEKYRELQKALDDLDIPNPFKVLEARDEENAFLIYKNVAYVKEKVSQLVNNEMTDKVAYRTVSQNQQTELTKIRSYPEIKI